jgi:hypothetical protein
MGSIQTKPASSLAPIKNGPPQTRSVNPELTYGSGIIRSRCAAKRKAGPPYDLAGIANGTQPRVAVLHLRPIDFSRGAWGYDALTPVKEKNKSLTTRRNSLRKKKAGLSSGPFGCLAS